MSAIVKLLPSRRAWPFLACEECLAGRTGQVGFGFERHAQGRYPAEWTLTCPPMANHTRARSWPFSFPSPAVTPGDSTSQSRPGDSSRMEARTEIADWVPLPLAERPKLNLTQPGALAIFPAVLDSVAARFLSRDLAAGLSQGFHFIFWGELNKLVRDSSVSFLARD